MITGFAGRGFESRPCLLDGRGEAARGCQKKHQERKCFFAYKSCCMNRKMIPSSLGCSQACSGDIPSKIPFQAPAIVWKGQGSALTTHIITVSVISRRITILRQCSVMLKLGTQRQIPNASVEKQHNICWFPIIFNFSPFVFCFIVNDPLLGEKLLNGFFGFNAFCKAFVLHTVYRANFRWTSPSLMRTGTASALENQATTYPVTCLGHVRVFHILTIYSSYTHYILTSRRSFTE